jgi:c(7)-type cytochrome triheme protein
MLRLSRVRASRVCALALLALVLPAAGQGTKKRRPLPHEYGRVVMDTGPARSAIVPAVFDHWTHRVRYTCRVCHVDVGFAMLANQTGVKEADNRKGFYCGACHDGKLAFGPKKNGTADDDPSCIRCHVPAGAAGPDFGKATASLPRGRFGNGIDWEAAELDGKIHPLDTLAGVTVVRKQLQIPPDYDIEAKVTTLPEIVFSHKKHAVWGGCELCHPDVFTVKRGATKFTMEEIFKGRYCGACHGTVAFPAADCQRCHTKPVGA